MRKKGFTLIELLIVIGIIGILAAGILAAIDPLEQLKKGRDSQKRSTSIEIFNAITRYYAVNGSFPWGAGAGYGPTNLQGSTGLINSLITVGELKAEFYKGLAGGLNTALSVYGKSPEETVYVCFNPESKAISNDPSVIYGDQSGNTSGTCPNVTGVCYWCAK